MCLQNEMERAQLRETVKAYRSEIEASEANIAAEAEATRKAHAEEVRHAHIRMWPTPRRPMRLGWDYMHAQAMD